MPTRPPTSSRTRTSQWQRSHQAPNAFVDELLRHLPRGAERLLWIACRKIGGWEEHRRSRRDRISLSQFVELSGMTRPTVRRLLDVLHAANILVPDGPASTAGREYELNLGQLGAYNLEYLAALRPDREHTGRTMRAARNAARARRAQPALLAVPTAEPLATSAPAAPSAPPPAANGHGALWRLILPRLPRTPIVETAELVAVEGDRYVIRAADANGAAWLSNRVSARLRAELRAISGNAAAEVVITYSGGPHG